MSACKDKYKWCKDEPFVYKDNEGKDYCVFHAPQGEKGVSLEAFNRKVFSKISQGDLSGTIFEGDIGFNVYDKDNPLPRINFSNAVFSGEVDFSGSAFGEEARFSGATFSDEASFIGSTFSRKASFSNATFSGEAWFPGVVFSGEANFSNATFDKDKRAWFFNAKFGGEAWFDCARFGGEANFLDATFSGEADFRYATFGEIADFDRAKFNEDAYFYGGTFKRGIDEKDVDTVVFEKGAKFQNFSAKEKIRFERVNLKEVSFLDSDLRDCDFINCEWQKQGGIKIMYDYFGVCSGREVLHDEVSLFGEKDMWIWRKVMKWWLSFKQRDKEEIKENREKIRKVEILYRRLKQKYVDEHDWPEVSNWHYGEKEMYRKGSRFRRFFPLTISNLYWAFGGYGERPVRAGVWLGVFILGISALTALTCFEPSPEKYGYEGIDAYLLNTLQYVTFQKETIFTPASRVAEWVALFARAVIPLQAALFVLAVRNRFRR